MAKERISVVILRAAGGKTLEFSVSKTSLKITLPLSAILLAVFAFCAYGYFSKTVHNRELARLREENQYLTSKVTQFSSEISQVRGEYAQLIEKEKQIRVIFDLPEVDPQERSLGTGGPEFTPVGTVSYGRTVAYEAENRLDELIRLSTFEKEQYDQIYDAVFEKKQRLDHTPSVLPTAGHLIRGFGIHADPFTGLNRMHSGFDISNRIGTPVYAPADGIVASVSFEGDYGRTLLINHGHGVVTLYGHLSKATAKVGQAVKRGDKIAEIGSSGRSTGPHLHYAVSVNGKFVNPGNYIVDPQWLAE